MTPEQSKALPLVKVSAAALKARQAERAKKAQKPVTKSDFVRQHPGVPAADLVKLAAKQGLRLSKQLVYVVRGPQAPALSATPATTPVKRGPGRPKKTASSPADRPAHARRGPGRPRKHAVAPAEKSAPRRGPGRPRNVVQAGLTRTEKEFATLLLAVGLDRAEQLIAGLKRTLGA